MKIAVLINSKANSADKIDIESFKSIASKLSLNYQIFIKEPAEIEDTLKNIIQENYEVVMVAGGDGSIRSAAQFLYNTEVTLAIWPIGTFNHFAKTLNIPEDLEKNLQLIQKHTIRKVDLAEVNDHVFINNASIGLYPKILKVREKYTELFSRNKLFKIFLTIMNVFSPIAVYKIALEINNKQEVYDSLLIFLGNNYYSVDLEDFGERDTLAKEELSMYILKCKNKKEFFKILLKVLFRINKVEDYLEQYTIQSCCINANNKSVDIALDGEIFKMNTPLNFKTQPKALKVIAP